VVFNQLQRIEQEDRLFKKIDGGQDRINDCCEARMAAKTGYYPESCSVPTEA
jgi:hypothetical protein